MAKGFKALFPVGFEYGVATSTIKMTYSFEWVIFIFEIMEG